MARRNGKAVRLYTRNGYDFADRFPQIAEAISSLPVQSCFIDGEAIAVDERGLSVFDFLRYRCHDHAAILCAFDLIELDDPAKAKELIKAYGKPVEFKMVVTATPRGREIGQIFQEFWRNVGANATIDQTDQTALVTKAFRRDFKLRHGGLLRDDQRPGRGQRSEGQLHQPR